jgi:hypothetical protein
MITEVAPGIQKMLALAILLVAGVFVWSGILAPTAGMIIEKRAEIDVGLERLERYATLAARADQLRAWSSRRKNAQPSPRLFVADTPAVAAANLQRDLVSLASRFGIRMGNTQVLKESMEGPVLRIGVQSSFSTSNRSLMQFLEALHEQARFIEVRDLKVSAPNRQVAGNEPVLRVNMETVSYMLTRDQK